jgi:hypothetical protein
VQQLRKLNELFETTGAWYDQVRAWPTAVLVKFLKLGDRLLKAAGIGS